MLNIISQYNSCDENIQKAIHHLENLNNQIDAIPEEKIKELRKIKANLTKDINHQHGALGGAEFNIASLKEQREKYARELNSIVPSNDLIVALKLKKEFIEKLYSYLEKYLSEMEIKIRLHVISEVNSTLEKFSRHDFHIKVSEKDFKIYLRDKNDNEVAQGDGLNLLLNLTVTASLINFAASRKEVKDPILNSATVAPLIIDAPFGVLDKRYRNVVVNQLPKHANQVVFLVSSSQWTDDMEDEVRELIGSEYCLVLEESSEQKGKDVDKIIVNKSEFIVSRYGCDIDRTVIEEISNAN